LEGVLKKNEIIDRIFTGLFLLVISALGVAYRSELSNIKESIQAVDNKVSETKTLIREDSKEFNSTIKQEFERVRENARVLEERIRHLERSSDRESFRDSGNTRK